MCFFFSRRTPRNRPEACAQDRVLYHIEVRTLNARRMFREQVCLTGVISPDGGYPAPNTHVCYNFVHISLIYVHSSHLRIHSKLFTCALQILCVCYCTLNYCVRWVVVFARWPVFICSFSLCSLPCVEPASETVFVSVCCLTAGERSYWNQRFVCARVCVCIFARGGHYRLRLFPGTEGDPGSVTCPTR